MPAVEGRRYAFVDLTSGSVETAPVPLAWRRSLLGGRGINALLLARHLPRGTEPFAQENVLVLGAGMLTGTTAASNRMHVTFKSPESAILGDGSIGGGFGAAMRRAGFDHLAITGRAERPSLLWIEDARVEVRDASSLWGLGTIEAQTRLRAHETQDLEVLVAGPAGERLVRFACIRSGAGRSARCGGGAVMGSKLLKAVVARGAGAVPVAEPAALAEDARTLDARVQASYPARTLRDEGTSVYYEGANALGVLRTTNGQRSTWPADLGGKQPEGERLEFSTLGLLGPNLGMTHREEAARLANVCNELGLDTSSAGTYLAWALELAQRGLIDAKLTGEPLRWGDAAQAERLLRACAAREGFGNVLAEGSRAVDFGYYPAAAHAFFLGVKGMPQSDATDVRFAQGFALGLAVASRGADHLRNRPGFEWFLSQSREAKAALYGAEPAADPASAEGKARAVRVSEDLYAVVDCLGVSKLLASGLNAPNLLGLPELARSASLASGLAFEAADLARAGALVADLERWLNLGFGVTRADDTLPPRYFDEPLADGPSRGARIDRKAFEGMLDEYYALRAWTREGMLSSEREAELRHLLDA